MLAKVPSPPGVALGFILIPFLLKNSVVFRCRYFVEVWCCPADDGMPFPMVVNRSYFSSSIFAVVRDGTGIIVADEWKGMYDGCYGSFVVEGDVVFCTRR